MFWSLCIVEFWKHVPENVYMKSDIYIYIQIILLL